MRVEKRGMVWALFNHNNELLFTHRDRSKVEAELKRQEGRQPDPAADISEKQSSDQSPPEDANPTPTEEPDPSAEELAAQLEALPWPELRNVAKEQEVEGYAKMKKPEMIAALVAKIGEAQEDFSEAEELPFDDDGTAESDVPY